MLRVLNQAMLAVVVGKFKWRELMELKDIIKFESIDLTHIIITIGLAVIVILAFKNQLNTFLIHCNLSQQLSIWKK